MIADAEEMAVWARREFGKEKTFVLGHSWGSFLGLQLATRHPEWLYAYIGACQLTGGPESERRGWRFSDQEIGRIWEGNKFAIPYLLPKVIALNVTNISINSRPLILFEGRHNRLVNSEVAADWFDKVEAPEKHLVWFEHSGHMPMTERPGEFFLSLVRFARPIAEKAGDVAP